MALPDEAELTAEIDSLRAELSQVAEPAAERALDALLRACAPYGVVDPELARAMVNEQVGTAVTARLQREPVHIRGSTRGGPPRSIVIRL